VRYFAVRQEHTSGFFIALGPHQFVLAVEEVAKSPIETQTSNKLWANQIRSCTYNLLLKKHVQGSNLTN